MNRVQSNGDLLLASGVLFSLLRAFTGASESASGPPASPWPGLLPPHLHFSQTNFRGRNLRSLTFPVFPVGLTFERFDWL